MGGASRFRVRTVLGRPATRAGPPREGRTMENLTPTLISWASILEDNTRAQAEQTATMPFIHPHVALMPDAHLGLGATVGSVIPTLGAIIPAAVGVDIGCGMIAVRTQYATGDLPSDRKPRAPGDRAGRPAQRRRREPHGQPRAHRAAARAAAGPGGRGRLRPGVVRQAVGPAAGHPRVGQPLHRGHRRRDRGSVAVPPLGLARGRQPDRAEAHRGRPRASAPARTCRTATWPTSPRARRSSTPTSARCGGRRPTRCSTARR